MIEPRRVLFLCTGNSARSIIAEYLLRKIGQGRFDVYSAGSEPTGAVNPYAVKVLADSYQIDASGARSKSWDELKNLRFDLVITVCDNARESCPIWPGQPLVAHWGVPDPALATGTPDEIAREFRQTAMQLQRRIQLFCSLPFKKLDRLRLEKLTREIGETIA